MVDDIIIDFERFTATDDECHDVGRLYGLVERWEKEPEETRRAAIRSMLGIFERHSSNTELGSPGPLVHAMESEGGYEEELYASVSHVPSHYGIWMISRMLNGSAKIDRSRWLTLLREVADSPKVATSLRDCAALFLSDRCDLD